MTPFAPFENPTITFFVGMLVGVAGTLVWIYDFFAIAVRHARRMRAIAEDVAFASDNEVKPQ